MTCENNVCDCFKTIKPQDFINAKNKYHDPNRELTYSFMEGSRSEQSHVREGVQKILDVVPGLKLKEVLVGGDIRITFDQNDGAWSYVGSDIFRVSNDQPTMNLGFFEPEHTVVVHEFLHSLSTLHEHLRGVNWDKPKVYEYFARIGWSRSDVDNNIFNFDRNNSDFSEIDIDSIMLYSLPCSLTTDGKNCGKRNTVMSKVDIERLNQLFPVNQEPETNCLLDSMRKVFSREKDLACLREANLVLLARELGIETDVKYKKSYTVSLIWQLINSA